MHQLRRYALLSLLLLPVIASSQGLNYVRVDPYPINNTYLNDYILGDTLVNGQRRDTNVVYVLQRGGLYLVNRVIQTQNWQLRIIANDSTTTRRPVIFLDYVPGGTTSPGQFATIRSHLFLKHLIISGYYETAPPPSHVTGLQGALINTATQGLTIIVDSCILTNTNGNHIRTDQAPRVLKVTNNIFANMGYLGTSNLGAGKGIDLRAGSCDSLIVMNNTFVNWQDRIIRHFASTLNIQYMRFEHNTLVNGMSYHGLLSLGRVGYNIIIRDNLLVDAFALGNDTDRVRQAEFTDGGELDDFGLPRMSWVIANPNDSTNWVITNNYYMISAAGQLFWDSASVLPIVANPALTAGAPLTHKINSRIGADSATAFLPATVTLPNIPDLMVTMMKWYRRPLVDGGAGKSKDKSNFSALVDFDRRSYAYWRDTLDCAYSTAHALYTAAGGGYPVGDLNWFPSRYADWLLDPISDVGSDGGTLATSFALHQNYPNPFNPATYIGYDLPRSADVTLAVFNLLGQKIATLVEGRQDAGYHRVGFDGTHLADGIYFYRITAGDYVRTLKMVLMK